jgi:hypothetical protein
MSDDDSKEKKELIVVDKFEVGNIIDKSLSSLSPSKIQELREKAADKGLELEVDIKQKVNQTRLAHGEIDSFVKTFEDVTEPTKGHVKMEGKWETGTGKVRIDAKKGCFIASYVYDDINSDEVYILEQFRDKVLINHKIGEMLIEFYYLINAYIIVAINKLRLSKQIKYILDKIVNLINNKYKFKGLK